MSMRLERVLASSLSPGFLMRLRLHPDAIHTRERLLIVN